MIDDGEVVIKKSRRKVQATMEAATMDAVNSAGLAIELQAAKSEVEMLNKENREWKAKEVDTRSLISCADTQKEALEVELKAIRNRSAVCLRGRWPGRTRLCRTRPGRLKPWRRTSAQ
ncbi:hypothetical protein Vafri_18358 [Volvox africanus]|uniref:Uncharacterized protein n=1 Tax=Volvox africanus TaxID=51714 RepID=A0A8J4F8L1_9CHLO|nr:hypothetical protein Vafri_18358 [Volvox africanus]